MTLLCQVCSSIFKGVQFLHETRPHHRCIEDVQKASTQGCYICRIIALEVISAQLTSESKVFEWYLCPPRGVPDGWLNLTIEMMSKVPDTEGFNDASVDGASSDAEEDDEKEEELCAWSWTLHKADGELFAFQYSSGTTSVHYLSATTDIVFLQMLVNMLRTISHQTLLMTHR